MASYGTAFFAANNEPFSKDLQEEDEVRIANGCTPPQEQFKLLPKVKTEWLRLLRSGMSQTQSQLGHVHNDGTRSYCCLGVLCLAIGDKLEAEGSSSTLMHIMSTYTDGPTTTPSSHSYERVFASQPRSGTTINPYVWVTDFRGNRRYLPLTVLNDELMFTFEMIADLIEDQL